MYFDIKKEITNKIIVEVKKLKTKDNFQRGAKVTQDNSIYGTPFGERGHSPQSEPPGEIATGKKPQDRFKSPQDKL